MDPNLTKRFDSAIETLAVIRADRSQYDSEEGQGLIRQNVAEMFSALKTSMDPYGDSLQISVERDDEEADLMIFARLYTYGRSGHYPIVYVHFPLRYLGSSSEIKPELSAFVVTERGPAPSLDALRKKEDQWRPNPGQKVPADIFHVSFTPVFVEEKMVSWSAVRHAHQAPEIVDLVLDQYSRAIESAAQDEALHRHFGFLFPDPSEAERPN